MKKEKKVKVKKPIYKRVWFWIVAILIVGGIATAGGEEEAATDTKEPATEEVAKEEATKEEEPVVEEEVAKEEEPVVEEEVAKEEEPVEQVSTEFENALGSARSYIDVMPFSHKSLADQLEFDGYPADAIEWAMAEMDKEADWNAQAVLSAESYLELMQFSKDGLVEQLEFDGFTNEQAQHGADAVFE